ncbi:MULTISPECIES: lytic transglycosylase domain-containing protein [Sphingobacterium]|nr:MULTISPECIES: lytic transglycosylase domain-containing protein [Sphingobacterium]MBA8987252.1 soluble lytic murein transglycosylase-like protein [Sphingobacterium soli]WFB64539.1 lytic transglycosylase domain-containing protein [Sphingobacterium sp. WM]
MSNLYSKPQPETADPFRKALDLSMRANIADAMATNKKEAEDDIYSRISFAETDIPLEEVTVKKKLDKYLSRFAYLKKPTHQIHRKADQLLPRIAKILKSYGVPEDFKYIAVVESSLNPKTTSHKGAGGYWQFMPATARLYGLKVNGSVDERLDLIKSTHAAAKYLKSLHKEFGDWTLAAAAYNVGGGSLRSSLRRQNKDSYYDLKLNSETAAYVYKIISMKAILETT